MPKNHQKSILSSNPFVILAVVVSLLLAVRRHVPKFKNNKMSSIVKHNVASISTEPLKEFSRHSYPSMIATAVSVALVAWLFVGPQKNTKLKARNNVSHSATTMISNQDLLYQIHETLLSLLLLRTSEDRTEICVLETKLVKSIKILINKCGRKHNNNSNSNRENLESSLKTKEKQISSSSSSDTTRQPMIRRRSERKTNEISNDDDFEVICLQAAFMVLENYPCHDEVISSSLALLALVAKEDSTRKKIFDATVSTAACGKYHALPTMNHSKGHGSDQNTSQLIIPPYSATVPIRVMREALNRAKQRARQNPPPEVQEEQLFAEVQRKGCLLLGVLADESTTTKGIAKSVVNAGGLEAVFSALEWFRYHKEVANWGLWAVFNFTYHFPSNKIDLFVPNRRTDGMRASSWNGFERICRVMNDNST